MYKRIKFNRVNLSKRENRNPNSSTLSERSMPIEYLTLNIGDLMSRRMATIETTMKTNGK